MPPTTPSRSLSSLFGGISKPKNNHHPDGADGVSMKLESDKKVYRPGDLVTISIQIRNQSSSSDLGVEKLSFEAKGVEKLDTQWFSTSNNNIKNNHKAGEYVFMESSSVVTYQTTTTTKILSSGTTTTYIFRMNLPTIIPPSYRGSTVRYLYHVQTQLSANYMLDHHSTHIEARLPLQIWATEKTNGLLNEETGLNGIVPATTIFLDVYWKDMDAESEWARANETFDGLEEDYDNSRDDVSSVSSYNPARGSLHKAFGSSLSLQSSAARSSKDVPYNDQRSTMSSYMALPRLSAAEVLYGSTEDNTSPGRSSIHISPSQQLRSPQPLSMDDDSRAVAVPRTVQPVASEGFIRGRSYNIRLDDQVLLRFSPAKPESTYYFGDMIGGTLTFFHAEGTRRCLEVKIFLDQEGGRDALKHSLSTIAKICFQLSVTLELSETISRRSAHPSRRHSPTITKIQSDHNEVVADLIQTSFLFSVPMYGPMSFSTRHVSVQWVLRFEFFTTPKNVDWTRYEHPLLIEGRDKCEWVLPI